jgi:hypothetical protein
MPKKTLPQTERVFCAAQGNWQDRPFRDTIEAMSVQETFSKTQTPETQPAPAGRSEEERRQVKQRRVNRLEKRWWKRRAVNLFLLWHAFALFMWLMPSGSPIVQACVGMVRPYMVVTAFAQSWSMFSPDPDRMDVYLEAQITYANGEKRSWEFPRMSHLGYVKRYEEERWRKMTEVATHGGNHNLWPALARYAARVNNPDPQNPPVSVELFQHSRMIPPPGQPIPAYIVAPLQTGIGPSITAIHRGDLPSQTR